MLLGRYNVPPITDDVYGELYFGDKHTKPAKAFDIVPGPIFSSQRLYANYIRRYAV